VIDSATSTIFTSVIKLFVFTFWITTFSCTAHIIGLTVPSLISVRSFSNIVPLVLFDAAVPCPILIHGYPGCLVFILPVTIIVFEGWISFNPFIPHHQNLKINPLLYQRLDLNQRL
jgi:hypothetical protein